MDDPDLTCRLPGMDQRSPVRVVISRDGNLPLTSRLATTARDQPTWMVVASTTPDQALADHEAAGIRIMRVDQDGDEGGLDLRLALAALAERGITRLLVEGGGKLAASLLKAKLVDRLVWFQAPLLLGGGGRPAISEISLERLAEAPLFERIATEVLASDLGATYITRKP
jgi:diaminohydroxyphosphoribosylaminopyrimidine deaminase/5-amino-6-(5-phosphoribosylamino)uracil reductase